MYLGKAAQADDSFSGEVVDGVFDGYGYGKWVEVG